jgi:DNA-binding cell septation regulator SpoVG
MFAVIYRAYLKTDKENQYQEYWKTIASYFVNERGALGSTLHKTAEGMWVAYSKWPDKRTRDASWPSNKNSINKEFPLEIQEAILGLKQMLGRRACIS